MKSLQQSVYHVLLSEERVNIQKDNMYAEVGPRVNAVKRRKFIAAS